MKNKRHRRAFTLIELLIVIAIIAVLATVVILSLNPAELLRQSRDSNRVSDMATMKSALALYLADVSQPNMGSSTYCYVSIGSLTGNYEIASSGTPTASTDCTLWMSSDAAGSVVPTTTRAINGTGWLPVNFSLISSGSPIGSEPVDPTNAVGNSNCADANPGSCGLFYSYVASSTRYKLATKMESSKYSNNGTAQVGNVESSDGGINPYMYESGTNLAL